MRVGGERLRAPARRATGPLRIIVARSRADERDELRRRFADLPDCQVIVDRRVRERRLRQSSGPFVERRRRERRSGELETARGRVLFIH